MAPSEAFSALPPVPQLSLWPRNPHSPQARSLTATAPLSFSPAAHFSFKPVAHLFCLCVLSESSFCSHHHHLSSEPLRHLLHGKSASWGTGSLSTPAACVTLWGTVHLCESRSFVEKEQWFPQEVQVEQCRTCPGPLPWRGQSPLPTASRSGCPRAQPALPTQVLSSLL